MQLHVCVYHSKLHNIHQYIMIILSYHLNGCRQCVPLFTET